MTRSARTYWGVSGAYNLSQFFIAPVYPLFLMSLGLDAFEASAVLAVYLLTAFAFDVPTGAIADVFGRKASFIACCVLRCIAYTWYASAETFTDCLIGEFIDAIGSTLATGSLEAWAVDRVRAEGGHAGDRLFARAQVISRAAMIGGGIACGYLAELGLVLTWYAAAAGFLVTGLVAAVTMEEPRPANDGRWAGMRASVGQTIVEGVGAVRAAPVLLALCVLTSAIAFGGFPLHMLWQAHVQALSGQGYWLVGWLVALLNLASLAGSALLPRVLARLGRSTVLAAAAFWRAAMLALLASATRLGPAVSGLFGQEISSGFTDPVLSAWTNEHVAPERRATVLSVRSTFFTFGGAAGLLCIGLVGRSFGLPAAFAASAVVFVFVAAGFAALGHAARGVVVPVPSAEPIGVPAKISPPAA
jgi:DHA3 family tetracycline resistance protein-like MFS transporter